MSSSVACSNGGNNGSGGGSGSGGASSSSSSTSSVAESSSASSSSSGGTDGGSSCLGCADLMGGDPATLCPGKSQDLYKKILTCACAAPTGAGGGDAGTSTSCLADCNVPCKMAGMPSEKCNDCVFAVCTDQVMACIADKTK